MYNNNGYSGNQGWGAATTVVSGNEYAQQNYAGHQQYQPSDLRYTTMPQGATCGQPSFAAVSGCGQMMKPQCQSNPEPAAYYPYSGSQGAAAFDSAYPNEEDMSSMAPRSCASSQQAGYALNVNSLMPAAWRGNAQCGDNAAVDGSQWTKYAPTKEAFDRYITAQGSARLSINTRNPLGRQVGIPDLLRQSPPMPLAAEQIVFNDSSFRQDQVFRQMGRYPESTAC